MRQAPCAGSPHGPKRPPQALSATANGGIIAYMLAGGGEAPDFIVSMAGPAVKGDGIHA